MGVLANFKIRTKVLLALLPLAIMVVVAALYASIQIKSIDTAYSVLIENGTKSYQRLTLARAMNNRFDQYLYREIAETDIDRKRELDADLDLTAANFLVAAEESKQRSPNHAPAIESVTALFDKLVSDSPRTPGCHLVANNVQTGAKIMPFNNEIRRKCLILSASYEIPSKLQNLYAPGDDALAAQLLKASMPTFTLSNASVTRGRHWPGLP
jgi:hypothetical protein